MSDPVIEFEGKDFFLSDGLEKIRDLMRRKGLTLEKIAPHLEVSAASVSRWLSGKARPSLFYFRRLPELLNHIDKLYPDRPDAQDQADPAEVAVERLKQLTERFPGVDDLPDEAQGKFLRSLSLAPQELFKTLLRSGAGWPDVQAFVEGYADLLERFPGIAEALEGSRK